MQNFSLRDQIIDRACYIFDRNRRVDTVLIEKINAICLELLQHALDGQSDVLGSALRPPIRPVSKSMFHPNFEEIVT